MGFIDNFRRKKEVKTDGFTDPQMSRGSSTDITRRMRGDFTIRVASESDNIYYANGFVQAVVNAPANDAVREWITVSTNMDTEDQNISRMIEKRLKEIGLQGVLEQCIANSRKFQKGGLIFIGTIGQNIQDLSKPLPGVIRRIDYLNVIDEVESVQFYVANKQDPTKKDYHEIKYAINGQDVHESRLIHLVDDFNWQLLRGYTALDNCYDAIVAQDSALWSVSRLMTDLVTKVFKSDMFTNLPPSEKYEFLYKMKHFMETNSVVGLASNEDFQKMIFNVTGIREVFDFIFDNLSGLSGIPKNILLGKSHGVVTAGEYDTLNYYANIAQLQENKLTPIVERFIDMIVHETTGEVMTTLGSEVVNLDYEFEWNSLWKLDPLSQADTDLRGAQRDQIDVTIGKATPQEVRELDPRYTGLEMDDSKEDLDEIMRVMNLEEPEIVEPVIEDVKKEEIEDIEEIGESKE